MYIAVGQGQTTPGDKIIMPTETSCHFGHLLQVSKKTLWRLIFYKFFHDFVHVYSPGAVVDNLLGTKFWCQQEHLVTSVICCKFQKSFMNLYTFIAPGQGQTAPQGTKFWCQQKCLVISFIWHLLQVSKKSLRSLILYKFFSWFNTCI